MLTLRLTLVRILGFLSLGLFVALSVLLTGGALTTPDAGSNRVDSVSSDDTAGEGGTDGACEK
jgi:hypothetical protein